MNTRRLRFVFLLLLVLLLVGIWFWTRPMGDAGSGSRSGTATAVGTGAPRTGTSGLPSGLPADPFGRPGTGGAANGTGDPPGTQPKDAPKRPAEPEAKPAAQISDAGTEVKTDQEVSIVVPWRRQGEGKHRYEIDDSLIAQDRETGNRGVTRWVWHVVLEVIEGDGSGAARLRVQVERFRYQFQHPRTGLPTTFDTVDPDPSILDDPNMGPMFRALLKIVGPPAEFRLDPSGTIADADGLDVWRERYFAEYSRLRTTATEDDPAIPTIASFVDRWREYLFPRFGGGTLKGGATREWRRSEPSGPPWAIEWAGVLRVTRDDPEVFRVDITASPTAVNMGGRQGGGIKMRTVGGPEAYRAAYRVSRESGAIVEAQIDSKYEMWLSQPSGGSPVAPEYQRTFQQIVRRVVVRRVDVR